MGEHTFKNKNMLEKLTKEQESIMIQTRDEWINLFFDNVKGQKGIDKPMFEDGIKWLYGDLLGKPSPRVVYCDSWLSCLITIAILKDNKCDSVVSSVGDSVSNSVGASVNNSVRTSVCDSVGDSVNDSVSSSVRASVRDSVWDSVWTTVGASIRASIRASVGDSVWDSFNEYSSYIDLSNYGWVSFFDFFEKVNVLDNFKFKQYKKLIKSGVFNAYEYENIVFAIQPPTYVSRDSSGRLHSVEGSSVRFKDSSEYFFIHGVGIKEKLYAKLLNNEYLFNDFINEPNEEIKSASLSFIEEKQGSEALFRFISSNLKEVDSYTDKKKDKFLIGTTGGMNVGVYTLFKGNANGIDLAFVRCFCPSTDRMFFLCVDPVHEKAKDAIASLYRIPKKVSAEIEYIQRQGERFSTVLTEKGKSILKMLSENEISDLVHISGEEYFSKMKYEY